MLHPWALIDAFTPLAFGGNPAAVVWLDQPRDDLWRQRVAMEMNQAETAFVEPLGDAFRLRWFTPVLEVDLCGHATLASAFYLWHTGRALADAPIHFETRSGRLTCRRAGDRILMDFPSTTAEPVDIWPADMIAALGGDVVHVAQSRFYYLVELAEPSQLRKLKPDFARLAEALSLLGVIVTTASDDARYDFLSRFFAPAAGINEDHATGSAHCCLGPYWSARLGKTSLIGYQASPRGAEVHVACRGERVDLGGQAVLVAEGTLIA